MSSTSKLKVTSSGTFTVYFMPSLSTSTPLCFDSESASWRSFAAAASRSIVSSWLISMSSMPASVARPRGVAFSDVRIDALDGHTLGATVTDVRLASLSDAAWSEIEAAFHEHAVLVFPGQHLTRAEQVAFARRFGEIERIIGDAESLHISNTRRDGSLLERTDPALQVVLGNLEWHTDSSYRPLAAKASMLSAHVVAPDGGATEWADMRATYDALPADLRAGVDGLSAHHSFAYSQSRLGYGDTTFDYGFAVGEAPLRPLVKVHPATGRHSLFIGRHAFGIPGLSESESEALLDELLAFACQPPRVLHHDWAVGDLVVWDNRCVLHRARPWDLSAPRDMVHTRVAGDPATEAA